MKNIVNVVNFVRGVEPRPGRNIDLVGTVREEIAYLRKNGLTGTFLMQYDAIINPDFTQMLKDSEFELGVWFETVQPQVEAAGEVWRGRYSWDWHNDVGFLIGYEPSVREKLIDIHMDKFREIFGYYPKSIGSWHIDAHSLDYINKKYEIDACCICRDQVGTDGYTMQGGYYNGAYYPTKNNMFCPDNSGEQIDIPIFRMLGSDAIYAYDYQVKKEDYGVPRIPTLEPASPLYGSQPYWIDSFFATTFCGHGISHQYTQAGQENSFGWEQRIKNGYIYQMSHIKKLANAGDIDVMTLGDAGRWYKENFKTTPPQALTALKDCINDRYKSVWYCSKYYRANLLWENGDVHIRDMYIFDNRLNEHYLGSACKTTACEFRTCPVIDGTLYGKDAGAYFGDIVWDSLEYSEADTSATVSLKNKYGKCIITFDEREIHIECDIDGFEIVPRYDKSLVYGKPTDSTELFCSHNNAETVISSIDRADVTPDTITFTFCGVTYSLSAVVGKFTSDFKVIPDNGKVTLAV